MKRLEWCERAVKPVPERRLAKWVKGETLRAGVERGVERGVDPGDKRLTGRAN